MSYFKRARTRARKEETNGHNQSSDPSQMDPNFMRDSVRDALLTLPLEERAVVRDRVLAALRKSGVGLGTLLILLGINVRSADELTPSDLAHLLRYLRFTSATKFRAVKPIVTELIVPKEKVQTTHETRKAA
ncbi:MAG TPA: hypothetical protein VEZ90_17235 [Blastocatellia bacterium]|nr:hypothetical protein [Blastocatellia bacterium]